MKIIWYGGLLKDIGVIKSYLLSRHTFLYFDYDHNRKNLGQLVTFASLTDVQKIMINIMPTVAQKDLKSLSNQLGIVSRQIDYLIVTSSNDLLTLLLRKYAVASGDNKIQYAFNIADNVDDNSYFVCDSGNPFLSTAENIKKVILDDRSNGNNGIIYKRQSFNHEDANLLTQNIYKKTKLR